MWGPTAPATLRQRRVGRGGLPLDEPPKAPDDDEINCAANFNFDP